MIDWGKRHLTKASPESYSTFIKVQQGKTRFDDPTELRRALLDFIADFANWDNSTDEAYLETARKLTQAAHEALGGEKGTRPLVVDPFAGGGSIPLEALRVGADAFASDLNPVPVLLNKVVLEYIPKYGQRLADEVRKCGEWIKREAEKELAQFYPKDADGATPIAYLWARTIQCEGPGCGAEVPLIRSLWLARKANRSVALQLVPRPRAKRVDFQIIVKQRGGWVNQDDPKEKIADPKFDGTVRRGSATCPCCGYTTPVARIRQQLKARHGGSNDAVMLCVVTRHPDEQSVSYRLPAARDFKAFESSKRHLEKMKQTEMGPLSLVPTEPTPEGGGSGAGRAFSQRNYGMDVFEDLFNHRQLLALSTFVRLIRQVGEKLRKDSDDDFAQAACAILSTALGKLADYLSTLCVWRTARSCVAHTFGRQAIPITWDFGEMNPFAGSAGDWDEACRYLGLFTEQISKTAGWPASAERANALALPLPDDAAMSLFTDPPYYDAVPYADLSDYFYVWHKRTLHPFRLDLLKEQLTPKDDECIVDEVKNKDSAYFESSMQKAMSEARRVVAPSGVGVVVFAHKSTGGWEALLKGLVDAGWTVTGSWPIDTERPGRLRANDSAALASSVHLVCRPRENPDGSVRTDEVGDWRDVLAELPRRIHEWMPRLAKEGVVGADAIFACLGPALEIYSRYSRVEKSSGEVVPLRDYLEQVWAAVSKEALSMIFKDAETAGLEPDARLTAMWLWTLGGGAPATAESADEEGEEEANEAESEKAANSAGFALEYDAARKIAQGLGVHLEKASSVVEVKGDTARLLSVAERTKHLFGKEDDDDGNVRKKKKKEPAQRELFAELEAAEKSAGTSSSGKGSTPTPGATVLDQVHQAMILFAAGRGEAMKRFLVEDGVGKNAAFWKLAQSLSALYPSGGDEKRWVDGVLARKKGLGF
jgi:adenine-specific DNA methylase